MICELCMITVTNIWIHESKTICFHCVAEVEGSTTGELSLFKNNAFSLGKDEDQSAINIAGCIVIFEETE